MVRLTVINMPRGRKKIIEEPVLVPESVPEEVVVPTPSPVTPVTPITLLAIDYPSEHLNDMARKINELIIRVNG